MSVNCCIISEGNFSPWRRKLVYRRNQDLSSFQMSSPDKHTYEQYRTINEEIRPLSEEGCSRSRRVARRPTFSKSHDMGIVRPSQRCFCRRRSQHRAATERARDDGGVGSARGRRCAHVHDLERSWPVRFCDPTGRV